MKKSLKKHLPVYLRRAVAFITLEIFLIIQGPMAFAVDMDEPHIPQAAGKVKEIIPERYQETVSAYEAAIIRYKDVTLEIPAGAVKESVDITIEELRNVRKLNSGMRNVTGDIAGYRFKPDGMTFEKEIMVTIPYDREKTAGEREADNIYTYFYNERAGYWERLKRVHLDTERGLVTSLTNHFTDIINSTITLPDSPEPLSFNPTSIKDIKAADPGAGINLIAPPQVNQQGNAALSYPIEVPPGRGGMQAQVEVNYNSDGGNGWMGLGWNIPMQSVSIDTRWGVPRYSLSEETETYMLDGQQLTPLAHRVEPVPRQAERTFQSRVEGNFRRIIRHGTSPSSYWWEVAEKNGRRLFYGGVPETGLDSSAVLSASTGGSIFRWALIREEDANGNRVNYQYVRVSDSGTGDGTGSVQGMQLYLQEIHYTGYEDEAGAYRVRFLRDRELGELRRLDVTIDGRAGFKVVTADLLRRIEVSFQSELVRSYELVYTEGVFHKTLLETIIQYGSDGTEFHRHTFTYYDDIQSEGVYQGFGETQNWDLRSDSTTASLMGVDYGTALGTNFGLSGGVHIYVGVGPGTAFTKKNSAGFKVGNTSGSNEGLIAFMDLNGDGLPDKIFKDGDDIYYRPNLSGPDGGSVFGNLYRVQGLPCISQDRSETTSAGAENYFGLFVSVNYSSTVTTGSEYFSDVNGDGLVDFVSGGQVYFNHLENGVPVFTLDSGDTPSPVEPGSADTNGISSDFGDLYEQMIDNTPLLDAVRVWTAPFAGTVQIEAPVWLAEVDRGDYQTADGVRVAIQHRGNELWSATIGPDDSGTKVPQGVNEVPVAEGDRIYFRVQSVFDGSYDQVEWDPEITYRDAPVIRVDANGLDLYRYKASEEFVYAGRGGGIQSPITGTVRIVGDVHKLAPITDDIRLVIKRNGARVIERELAWDVQGPILLDDEIAVQAQDFLTFYVEVDSPIDLSQIEWAPEVYYVAAEDDSIPLFDENGEPTIQLTALLDMDLYPDGLMTGQYAGWVVPYKGRLIIKPSIPDPLDNPPPDVNGTVYFTLKKDGLRLAKRSAEVENGYAESFGSIEREVEAEERFFFEFSSRNPELSPILPRSVAQVKYEWYEVNGTIITPDIDPDDPNFEFRSMPRSLHLASVEANLLSEPYRGWSYFAYNGNRERATQPIDEAALVVDEGYGQSGLPDAFFIIPYPSKDQWKSDDEEVWVASDLISSSRLGSNFIATPDAGGGARGVPRISRASQTAISGNFSGVGGSVATGTSTGELDFLDLNGDRYPDIVGSNGVQFTEPTGGLEETNRIVPGYGSGVRKNDNSSANIGIGGNVLSMIPNDRGEMTETAKGKMGLMMPPLGLFTFNLLGEGSSDTDVDLMDINSDGLPDRVRQTDSGIEVSLNLGYRFAGYESWGVGEVHEGKTKQAPLSLSASFNIDKYSFGGGVSLSSSRSWVEESLVDMNGDGLLDRVLCDGSTMEVGLNTGGGFAEPVHWHGSLDAHNSNTDNVSLGEGLYFTFAIPLPPPPFGPFFRIVINPGENASQSVGRHQSAIRDVNGDGYADHIASDSNSLLTVALSQVGRTNKLEGVNRPLGASFELSYERDGNTYDLPQSKWVLSKVIVQDGHAGDGVDSQVTTFTYDCGMHNRHEREFYGYNTVTTEQRDPSGGDALHRTITRTYHNDSFYTKGLLESEVTRDADGNKFNETVNQYYLFDVHTQSTFIDTYPNNAVATVFPQLIRTDKLFYEGQSSYGMWTYNTFDYDEYGNVTRYYDAGHAGAGDDVEAEIEYHVDLASYIVGKPSLIEVYGNGLLLRHREASYEPGTGNLIELRQYLADGQAAVTNLEYFANGNLKSVTGPSNLSGERYIIEYQYDPVVSTHIAHITDSYGYTSSAEYNLFYGLEKSSVELNGNLMRREYDHFGRLERVFAPYDEDIAAIEFAYYPDELPARAVTRNKIHFDPDNSETLDTVLFIDGLKRVIQTKKEGEVLQEGTNSPAYGMNVTGKVLFDLMGRVWQQGQPVFEQGYTTSFFAGIPLKNPTVNQYDILGRTTRVTLPDASEIATEYSIEDDRFKTRVVDPEGKVKISYADIRGNTGKIEQFNQGETITTVYEYNSLNEITAVIDTLGNTTSITYDNLGRRSSIHNPDSGLVESVYDLSGNLVKKIDGNLRASGQAIRYEYEYNRLIRIDYPESSDVEYEYGGPGAGNNRAGRLSQVIDESGATEFFYGKLGEEVKNIKTMNFLVPGHEPWSFTSETGFDYLGRVEWTEYPDGERLVYEYDRGGQIKRACGEKQGDLYDYVKEIHYDEYGQRIYIKYGNDVETRYSYDPYRRWLETIDTGNSEGIIFQDVAYSFDRVGNVLSINNIARDVSQSFQYDDLYQLIGAEGESPDKNKTSQYTQSFEYDSIGNIIRKTSSNLLTPGNSRPKELNYDFTYTYGGNRPHAATQIGGWAYQYDENGNTIGKERIEPGDGGGVSGQYLWNEENRLTEAKVNGKSTYFLYNASGERTVKRGENGETLYVNKFYQLQNRQEVTKHFFVGETRIVSKLSHYHNPDGLYDSGYERNNLYTYHADHIGSTTYVTDPYGEEFEHLEYTPYGETWVDEGTNKNIIGYRFTSKELDTETGLYYFGARYLDPQTSRWVSPELILKDYLPTGNRETDQNLPSQGGVFNPVNLNLYHYSANNPVTYIDPGGLYFINVKTALNAFFMQTKRFEGRNLGRSNTPVSAEGCFAIAYGREANAWSAYMAEQRGVQISEDAPAWMENPENVIGPAENFAEGDLLKKSVRENLFEAITGKTPEVREAEGTSVAGLLNLAGTSEKPYTAIGTIKLGGGMKHAFNIVGYDPETEMVTGYDTSTTAHNLESRSAKELLDVRIMTYEGDK